MRNQPNIRRSIELPMPQIRWRLCIFCFGTQTFLVLAENSHSIFLTKNNGFLISGAWLPKSKATPIGLPKLCSLGQFWRVQDEAPRCHHESNKQSSKKVCISNYSCSGLFLYWMLMVAKLTVVPLNIMNQLQRLQPCHNDTSLGLYFWPYLQRHKQQSYCVWAI